MHRACYNLYPYYHSNASANTYDNAYLNLHESYSYANSESDTDTNSSAYAHPYYHSNAGANTYDNAYLNLQSNTTAATTNCQFDTYDYSNGRFTSSDKATAVGTRLGLDWNAERGASRPCRWR